MGPENEQRLWHKMEMGVMPIKGYPKLHRAEELVPHLQVQFSDLLRTQLFLVGERVTSRQGYTQRILILADRTVNAFINKHMNTCTY